MRDDPPKVGLPRKGTQRKSRERSERFKSPTVHSGFQLDDDTDFQAQSDPRGSRKEVSPLILASPTSISSIAMSMDSVSSDVNQYDENDSSIISQDALCAFCNCGSEMAQILGHINRYYPSSDFDPFKLDEQLRPNRSRDAYTDRFLDKTKDQIELAKSSNIGLKTEKRSVGRPPGKKKKRGRHALQRHQHLSADMSTFGAPTQPEIADVFDADGCIWAHHCCAAWSAGVCQTDSYDLENVDKAAFKAISEQCCHCKRHGASVECQIQKCTKLYHYPCCASAGAFQDIKSMVLLCPEHLDHATRLAGPEAFCVLCDKAGDISKQLFCTSCGRHYHGNCLDPPVSISSIVRMGWQCPECKVCQGCRQPGDDEKMLFCDECDKGFHTYCLSPPMSSVPKTAWKCYSCRKCEDCGSNVPGSGPSCRWHFNYTVCDRCYQQRKKITLQCCPMCGKAIRNMSGELGRQCSKCTKFIHSRCDKEMGIDIEDYYCPDCRKVVQDDDSEFSGFLDHKEESNDSLLLSPVPSSTNDLDAEYLGQRTVTVAEAEAISRTATGFMQREPSPLLEQNEIDDLKLNDMDINFDEVMMETGLHGPLIHDLDDLKPDSSDSFGSPPQSLSSHPYTHQLASADDRHLPSRVASTVPLKSTRGKKKMSPFRCRGRPPGSTSRGRKSKANRGGRPRSKSTSNNGPNKENIQQTGLITAAENSKKDDSDDAEGLHSTVIMVSTKDNFSLGQDICMCCGSFGKGSEGHLIACAHCGQCFHPYCVNVKINKVLMTKGWRCLDCTVCEGCGNNEDEGKLLLCDGCDISYHIYCLEPPLHEVPPDGWKCQWCVECVNCGATSPGVGCTWMASYTQCGPCASETSCSVCNKTYLDDELVIKCTHCSRWLHADCDGLASEDDAELAASYGYHCCLCRDKTGQYGIFSSSWTKIVEKGVYTGLHPNRLTPSQTVIVTQTTTTVMATGISNRKSRSLTNRAPLKPSGWSERLPLHPVQTSAQGTFEVKLPGLKMKARREEIAESDSVSLTDKGLRQIKSMIVKAPIRGQARGKDRISKLSNNDTRINERETKTSGQLTETSACSEDSGVSRQPICSGSDDYHIEYDTDNSLKDNHEKRSSIGLLGDRRSDQVKIRNHSDKRNDPIDFFGSSLLKISKKKRKKDCMPDNDTQSSEDELEKNQIAQNERQSKQSSQSSVVTTLPDVKATQKSGLVDLRSPENASQHRSWPSKIPAGVTVDSLSENLQHSDSLYKTLNMLVNGPEDESQAGRELHHDQHRNAQKSQHHFGSSKQHPTSRHGSQSALSEHGTSIEQSSELTPTGDLDLIGLSDLPHVEGHEVEEIFAGIEREMSVDGTPRSHGQSPMETSLSEFPKSEGSGYSRDTLKPTEDHSSIQNMTTTSTDPVLTSVFTDRQQRQQTHVTRQDDRQYEVYHTNPSFQQAFEHRVDYKGHSKQLTGQAGETDAFKAVFGEEPEIKAKSRDGASSPKIDGQKQLKKWEQDEKLGESSTISPVLYANMVHPELKIDYPDWPNRARAIARLWRKLPQEQREPFRLRARDNRVKQKDQGRKLGTFKKPSSTPTSETALAFANAPSALQGENRDHTGSQNNAETTAIDVLSSSLMLNGDPNNPSLPRTPFPQNVNHPFVQEDRHHFQLEGGPIRTHEVSRSYEQGDHNVFRQDQGQFLIGREEERMHDPMLLQAKPSGVVSPSLSSLQNSHLASQQSLPLSRGRLTSDGSGKAFSLTDLCSPTTTNDTNFTGTGLTPTTPVFPTSPFQSTSYGADNLRSPGSFMSPSLPIDNNIIDKKKTKKQSKTNKEQLEIDKEKKKKKLAVDQEKERQWKLLQQQRLKEQQYYQQTSSMQQVFLMKEQMKKENNKSGRKQQQSASASGQDNSIRSSMLPPVEPFALTHAQPSDDRGSKIIQNSSQASDLVSASSTSNTVKEMVPDMLSSDKSVASTIASHIEYLKDDMSIPTDQASIDSALFLTDMSSKDSNNISNASAVKSSESNQQPGSSLDKLLQINNMDFAKMANTKQDNRDSNTKGQPSCVDSSTGSSTHHWDSSTDMTKYSASPSFPLQPITGERVDLKTASSKEQLSDFLPDRSIADSNHPQTQQQQIAQIPSVCLPDGPNQTEAKAQMAKSNQQLAQAYNVVPGVATSVISSGAFNASESLEKLRAAGFEPQQQQQALFFQQQQFMAAQQQYIQWQLQQRNPELFQSITAPVQYPTYADKDLPEVDSEEQHQERIRFLYRQRQMQKQQVVQMQQQLHQQQIIAQQQISGTSGNTTRPQMDTVQQQFIQQLIQQQQQTPEALQQQFLIEYNRQMQQRADAGQNVQQYDKFVAELAQQYGYTMPPANASAVSMMQHGMAWQNNAQQTLHPSVQQMFSYSGIDEEKAKELTPQQLYQLQLQHTVMMHQMAASGIYQPQSVSRNQSPSVSRKGSAGSAQERPKKSKKDKANKANTQQIIDLAAEGVPKTKDNTENKDAKDLYQAQSSQEGNEADCKDSQEKSTDNNLDDDTTKTINTENRSEHSSKSPFSLPPEATTIPTGPTSIGQSITQTSHSIAASMKTASNAALEGNAKTVELPSGTENDVTFAVNQPKSLMKQQGNGDERKVIKSNDVETVNSVSLELPKENCSIDSKNSSRSDGFSLQFNATNRYLSQNALCNDGIHCGTDSEDENCTRDSDDVFRASKIRQNDTRLKQEGRLPCTDGIHCGTDSEEEGISKPSDDAKPKRVCDDGIHCGTDSEEEGMSKTSTDAKPKGVCDDGIHCGTDSEEEGMSKTSTDAKPKGVCDDGIHCGTDSEEEGMSKTSTDAKPKRICDDGIHCGTDSEEEGMSKTSTDAKPKRICDDGIHCGTDSEEEGISKPSTGAKPNRICEDGIHCGTDSEDESLVGVSSRQKRSKKTKKTFIKGSQSKTDLRDQKYDEDEKGSLHRMNMTCTDGLHCGTDSDSDSESKPEDMKHSKGFYNNVIKFVPNFKQSPKIGEHNQSTDRKLKNFDRKGLCTDGIHCGTDSEDELDNDTKTKSERKPELSSSQQKVDSKNVELKITCSDGINCGTDSENEEESRNDKPRTNRNANESKEMTGSIFVAENNQKVEKLEKMMKKSPALTPDHMLEVIQEGDVTVNTFDALENINRSLDDSKIVENKLKEALHTNIDHSTTAESASKTYSVQSVVTSNVRNEASSVSSSTFDTHRIQREKNPSENSTSVLQNREHFTQSVQKIENNASVQAFQHSQPSEMANVNNMTQSSSVTSVVSSAFNQQPSNAHISEAPAHPDLFSAVPATSIVHQQQELQSQARQRAKIVGIPPSSPQYQQVFLHQHQLLIMQFQQYQYQLQAQYQQLSQQQMSPQQQFLLQQQYHQQIMLLQRQFLQQQAQLQAMASAGIQFTEQELNVMYQQQMVAQQAYNQWVATLSLDQQGQLHARMQANMQQVQQGMAAIMQNVVKSAPEAPKEKTKKPRGRRPRKTKTESPDPLTPAPATPTLPATPASAADMEHPSTPNKDQGGNSDVIRARNIQQASSKQISAVPTATTQQADTAISIVSDSRNANQPGRIGNAPSPYTSKPTYLPEQRVISQRPDMNQPYPGHDNQIRHIQYHQAQNSIEQQVMQMQQFDWQQQQRANVISEQSAANQTSQLPKVDIVPEGSNPFSDVYREIEKKSKSLNPISTPVVDQTANSQVQGILPHGQNSWKHVPANSVHQARSENSDHNMPSASAHPGSVFYHPVNTGNPPSIQTDASQDASRNAETRAPLSQPYHHASSDNLAMYSEHMAVKQGYDGNKNQYFDQARGTLPQAPMQSPNALQPSQNNAQLPYVAQYSMQSTMVSHVDNTVVHHSSHAVTAQSQHLGTNTGNIQSQHWHSGGNEQSYNSQIPNAAKLISTPLSPEEPKSPSLHSIVQPGGHQIARSIQSDRLMPPPRYESAVVCSPVPYSLHMNQPVQIEATDPNMLSGIPSGSNVDTQVKEQSKPTQKRKRGGQASHSPTANVDFSQLNPEEQRRFILERKREDFERRRRILEEQKQSRLKEQRNIKTAAKKIDKKLPRTKQRKLKNGREKMPIEKTPVPHRLVIDDKSLKLPLCEPEVHLLYPLVQPYGSGYSNGESVLLGVFGNALVQGIGDYYAQFPSPDPPVTSSNPPTPPASLPPSPGTINQSLRESLQMIPTEGIFDDLNTYRRQKDDNLSLFGAEIDRPKNSAASGSNASPSADQFNKESNDDVLVTLTMSNDDVQTATDRVSNVTNMLGVAEPNRIQVTEETKVSSDKLEGSNLDPVEQRPLATSIGKEKDVHFSCRDAKKDNNYPVKNKAPFCKHCDISIQGTGYVQCKDGITTSDPVSITVDNVMYSKIVIKPGQEIFDVFCSQLCLKSYHSLSKSNNTADVLNNELTDTDDSAQLIDPIRSVIPVSTGEASDMLTAAGDIEMRGNQQATGLSRMPVRRRSPNDEFHDETRKKAKYVIWKRWKITFGPKRSKTDFVQANVVDLLKKYGAALKVDDDTKDNRECMLCGERGDGVTEGTARLINYDVDVWVHLNCALWSLEVYETLNGALHNVQKAYERGIQTPCVYCGKKGATITCARVIGSQMRRCDMNYHFNCAIRANCTFFKDKTVLCPQHRNYGSIDQRLPSYAVLRKVYVNRDVTRQLARVLRLNNEKESRAYTIRVGSLIFHDLGQLLPHQLQKFHTKEAIYPIGFQTTRIYWSTTTIGRRCRYLCAVNEIDGNPQFTVTLHDCGSKVGQYAGETPKEVWSCILEPIRKLRQEANMVKIFPEFMTGEDIFGLTDPSLQRIIESLPGVDTIHDYSFRFGRTPIIMAELPLAVNPTGCIRSESTRHVHLNRPVSLRTASSTTSERADRSDSLADDNCQGSMLRNNWAMTKTAQYRKLKSDWKNIVLLSKSRIQGLGLFASRDIEANTMIIEYIGSMIRNEVANKRERIYEDGNRGVYMFRVDSETVIDATLTGGPARYINHSCDPNCVAEVVVIEKMPKIIIISNRKIEKGEELTYDYKFEFEDDQHKIACLCGATNCRKWMN